MSTPEAREAMRRVIQRLAEFEPHCAEDLREEFLPDARWEGEVSANGVPECDARLVLPPEHGCVGCICVFKNGERYHHAHCMAFHDTPAVGHVVHPTALTVQRGHWSGR